MFGRRVASRGLFKTDESEVSKFSRVASDWWDPKSRTGMGPLHALNSLRLQYIRQQVLDHFSNDESANSSNGFLHNRRVVDVGCGGGLLSECLARAGASSVTAIDPSTQNIEKAQYHSSQDPYTSSINYKCQTIESLVSETQEPFDVVCSLEVLEHVADYKSFVKDLVTLTSPNGLLFISTLNRTLASYVVGIVAAEHVLNLVPVGTHDWNKFVTPTEVCDILHQSREFVDIDVCGMAGLSTDVSTWSLNPSFTEVNYILCARKKESLA